MQKLYNKVYQQIETIDFNQLWKGFKAYPFALYNDEKIYFNDKVIAWDQRFIANTSIEYDGQFIAIWKITDSSHEDPEILASNLIHEMFHAFQQDKNETRWPHDLVMLNYPETMDHYIYKYQEQLLLIQAFACENKEEKRKYFKRYVESRKYRESMIGDIINQEYLTETIEGMAEYIGTMSLKQINKVKYQQRINTYLDTLKNIDHSFFMVRQMSYYIGTLFCILLNDLNIDFYHHIGQTDHTIFQMVSQEIDAFPAKITFNTDILSKALDTYSMNKQQQFDDFLKKHNKKTYGDFIIVGYDPMNMSRLNHMILCNRFIMLKEPNNQSKPVFIEGPILLNLKKDTIREVESYIQ